MSYFRATDPFPLESSDWNRLHEFYERLAEGRLMTTACAECRRAAWPPRAFCPECRADRFDWVELPTEGVVHAFTIQETGLPTAFDGPRIFAIVTVDGHRVFTILVDADPTAVTIGQRVRLHPIRVADDSKGNARWLPAFTPV